MLIIGRKESEKLRISDNIIVTVVRITGSKVQIGIDAPPHIEVVRRELDEAFGEEPTDVIYGDEECDE